MKNLRVKPESLLSRDNARQAGSVQLNSATHDEAVRLKVLVEAECVLLPWKSAFASVTTPAIVFSHRLLTEQSASGYRNYGSGALNNVGSNGNYWSSAAASQSNAYNLNFNSSNVYPLNNNKRSNGFSVRPVRAFKARRFYPFC